MLFETWFYKNVLLTQGKVHFAKMRMFFRNFCPLILALCFLPSSARSLKRTKNTAGSKLGYWDPLAHFEVQVPEILGAACVTRQQGFTMCCLSVVPSVSVESAMESNDALSGTM